MGLSMELCSLFLKKLKKIMPMVASSPINILSEFNFKLFSFTRLQNTATTITDSKLHDLAITTAGKEA